MRLDRVRRNKAKWALLQKICTHCLDHIKKVTETFDLKKNRVAPLIQYYSLAYSNTTPSYNHSLLFFSRGEQGDWPCITDQYSMQEHHKRGSPLSWDLRNLALGAEFNEKIYEFVLGQFNHILTIES